MKLGTLLDPVDRISEVLFGLVMSATIIGSMSIGVAEAEVREVLVGALGCNLAWGMVDALMYLMRELTERSRRAFHGEIAASAARLGAEDYVAAFGVFVLVVAATFPVVLPFMLFSDVSAAMDASRWITLGMLFLAGFLLGRYAHHPRPLRTGLAMAACGAVVIVAVMALGG